MYKGYFTDIENAKKLGLTGTTLQVYSTLRFLCQNQPWKRNDPELADKSGCGSRMTATRAVEKLKSSGLIFEKDKTITLKLNAQNEQINAQNEQIDAQNEQTNAQNEQISKEKEKNQKNKENKKEEINENSMCIKEAQTHTTASPNLINQLFFMNTIEHPTQDIPANTGYYKIIVLEYGYLKPKEFIDDMYLHYESHGWPYKGNKLELMRYWMTRYTKLKHSHKPNLDENERIILRTFLDKIEQRLIVRLLDVLQGFEVTDKAIIFRVKAENTEKFTAWLTDIDAPYILAAYNREVQVGRG